MYIVIGKSNCSYCSDLRAELNKKNIPYTYLDQKYCHADILDGIINTGVTFYPFVLQIKKADNIDDLIKSITN